MLGVSTTIVRRLEKEGIIAPDRNEENNYRRYGYEELDELIRWNYLRSMGYQLPSVKRMTYAGDSIKDIQSNVRAAKNEIVREILLNKERLTAISKLESDLNHEMNEVFFESFSELCFLPYYDRDKGIIFDAAARKQLGEWIGLFPIAYPIHYGTYKDGSWRFMQSGIVLQKDAAQRLKVCMNNADVIGEMNCLSVLFETEEPIADDLEACAPVRNRNAERITEIMLKNGIRQFGDMYYRTLNRWVDEKTGIRRKMLKICVKTE